MAVPTGTYQTFQAIGNREDLEDIIWNISPMETPFQNRIAKGKAKATYHEWQTDALDAAAANIQVQGDDAATNTATPTVRLRNYCQILSKTARVSGTQEAVDKAGRASEMAYQVKKRMQELKRDLEYALVRNQQSTSGTASVGASMAGLESWIATNVTSMGLGSGFSTPGYSGGTVLAPYDATARGSLTESALKSVIAAAWTQGGDPSVLMVGPLTKQKISTAFSGVATRYREVKSASQAQVISGVDLYVSDFGEHQIIPNRFMRDQNVLCLDLEYWELAQLRPIQSYELAKTGDSERRQILMECTLVARNEKASGKVADLDPTK